MRVLVTNIDLRHLTGTIVVVRDLALGLQRRGHNVTVYSPRLGEPAKELARQRITVVDTLDRLTVAPDVIHGHHNLPVMMALSRFIDTPAIWVNHGRGAWFDVPPKLSGISRYVAVDAIRRDLLTKVAGVPDDKVEILTNAVDLSRFRQRSSALPAVPKRLLLFAKTAGVLPTVEVSGRALGMEVDAIGVGVGRVTSTPERFLRKADIVLATGRMAIEALCAGAAVIVGDMRGIAGMVTSEKYNALRSVNFGASALIRPLTTASLEAEIRHYDAADAVKVSERMRRDADLETTIDRLEAIYRDAIAAGSGASWSDSDVSEVRKMLDQWPAGVDPDPVWIKVRAELAAFARRNDTARSLGGR
jgi:hypothetical protein